MTLFLFFSSIPIKNNVRKAERAECDSRGKQNGKRADRKPIRMY
jgi:hypothetical protein